MPYLIASVVLLTLLCLVNLALTVGIVRRLREHTLQGLHAGPMMSGLAVGSEVGMFDAVTVEGTPMSQTDLLGDTLVGFFSTDCPACHDQLPRLVERVRAMDGWERVIAVVTGGHEEAQDMVTALSDVAKVVREEHGGPLATAFAVRGWPLLFHVNGGAVTAIGHSVDALSAPVAAQ